MNLTVVARTCSRLKSMAALLSVSLVLYILFGLTGVVNAAPNTELNFQARLLGGSGELIPDGDYHVEFKLYDAETGGTNVWTETYTTGNLVRVENGYLTAQLGSLTAFPGTIDWSEELFLTLNVGGNDVTPVYDGEMAPRLQVTAVPYAFRAGELQGSTGAFTADDLAQLAPTGVQTVAEAVDVIRVNQTGSGGLLQLQGDGSDVFTVDKAGNTEIAGGLTVGNSGSTTAGTIRWNGADFEGFDGVNWVSLTSGSGGGGLGTASSAAATFYDAVGGSTITAGAAATINLDATLTNTDSGLISLAGDVITVSEDGTYEISYQVTSRLASGTRSGFNARLQLDAGGGFTNVQGGQSFHYGRVTSETQGTSSATVVLGLSAGDSIRLQGQGTTQSFTTIANATNLTILKLGDDGPTNAFTQSGNAFGEAAVLGTTDGFGLDIITSGSAALSFDAAGQGTFSSQTTFDGNVVLNGGSLTSASDLSLASGSGTTLLDTDTIRRADSGVLTLDLQDASGATGLSIQNSDLGQVANLTVEGAVTATSFAGSGAALTNLNANNITSGTISDTLLSTNIPRLDGTTNNFLNNTSFAGGLTVGNSALANAGNIRWTGTDFEGFDGSAWVSLTSGGGSSGPGDYISQTTTANSIASAALYDVFENSSYTSLTTTQNAANNIVYTPVDGRFTVPTGGTYNISASLFLENSVNSLTSIILRVNGADVYNHDAFVHTAVDPVERSFTIIQELNDGDFVELLVDGTTGNITAHGGTTLTIVPVSSSAGSGGGGAGGSSFVQNGNGFGATAILGTTDANGLNIVTNGVNALTITDTGLATFANDLAVSGGLNLSGDITSTGSLDISSGSGDLSLTSASGTIGINADTLQRAAPGSTVLDLLDASGPTIFSILNSDPSQSANLLVEGSVTSSLFSGNGSGITDINASNISSGVLSDDRLSSNVALLDALQTFTDEVAFSSGLVVGNSTATTAGAIRYTGSDFEGFDGTSWISLTTPGAPLLQGVLAFGKVTGATGAPFNIDGASVVRNSTGFYTVTFDTASLSSDYTVLLTVEEPAATQDDTKISIDNQLNATFDVYIHEGDNGGTADVLVDRNWHFTVIDANAAAGGASGGGSGTSFQQNGNAFGSTAILGTTDNTALRFVTNGAQALEISATGTAFFNGAITADSGLTSNDLITANSGLTVTSGVTDLDLNGLIDAGAISGVTTLDASGAVSAGSFTTTGSVTAATAGNTINGLIINSGSLDGVTGFNQTGGNFNISGTGTFTTGTGDIDLNGAVTAASTIDISEGVTINGSNANADSRLYVESSQTSFTGIQGGSGFTETYTFDADNDADEAAWTFVSDNGGNGLNPGNTARAWSHEIDDTASANVGPTSGQGGAPTDGYVYTEASGPAAAGDTFSMTYNTILDAAAEDWVVEFYWNQRGNSNTAILDVQTNEAGAGWVTRGTYGTGGPDVATSGAQQWNFESLDLTGTISNASTEVRFLVTLGSVGDIWHNDFGLDTITVRTPTATPGTFQYGDNLIEAYNANATQDVDLLVLRSDVGSTGNVVFRVDSDGDVFSDGTNNISGGADIAENYKNFDGAEAGDVVYFTDSRTVAKTSSEAQKGLAGVVSTEAAIILDAGVEGAVPVGLKGRLPTKVSIANGPIQKGDYVTSAPGGRAVKAVTAGPALGIAMEDASIDGVIDVFVGLTQYTPPLTLNLGSLIPGLAGQTQEQEPQYTYDEESGQQVLVATEDSQQTTSQLIEAGFSALQWQIDALTLRSSAFSIAVDDAQAVSVTSSLGLSVFNVDTTNGIVRIGSGDGQGMNVSFILDSFDEEPVGVNGAQYYSTLIGKFRCFEDGQWKDCINDQPAGSSTILRFTDTVADTPSNLLGENYWDESPENNDSQPTITPSSEDMVISGSATLEVTSLSISDKELSVHIERSIGVPVECGLGEAIGSSFGIFMSSPGSRSTTLGFIDDPQTTDQVFYAVCSDESLNDLNGIEITGLSVVLQQVQEAEL